MKKFKCRSCDQDFYRGYVDNARYCSKACQFGQPDENYNVLRNRIIVKDVIKKTVLVD